MILRSVTGPVVYSPPGASKVGSSEKPQATELKQRRWTPNICELQLTCVHWSVVLCTRLDAQRAWRVVVAVKYARDTREDLETAVLFFAIQTDGLVFNAPRPSPCLL